MNNVANMYDHRVVKEINELEALVEATQALIDCIPDADERQHHEASLEQVRREMRQKKEAAKARINGAGDKHE